MSDKPVVFFEEISKKLSEHEIADCADTLARKVGLHDEIAARQKLENSRWRSMLRDLDTEIRELSKRIRQKAITESVSCLEQLDFDLNRVLVRREDTGEVIRERPISAEERQRALFEEKE